MPPNHLCGEISHFGEGKWSYRSSLRSTNFDLHRNLRGCWSRDNWYRMRIPDSPHPEKRRNVRHSFGWKIRDHSYHAGETRTGRRGYRKYRLPRYSYASRKNCGVTGGHRCHGSCRCNHRGCKSLVELHRKLLVFWEGYPSAWVKYILRLGVYRVVLLDTIPIHVIGIIFKRWLQSSTHQGVFSSNEWGTCHKI